MNTKKMRSLFCLMLTVLMLFLSACTQESGQEEKEGEVLLPISINGKEIRVGETTLQTLLDEGLEVSWVDEDYNRITVDPTTQLEANAYYTGGNGQYVLHYLSGYGGGSGPPGSGGHCPTGGKHGCRGRQERP